MQSMAMRRNILFYIKLIIPYEEKCLLSGSCVQNVFGKVKSNDMFISKIV